MTTTITLPMTSRPTTPMPIFHGNPAWSFFGCMLFPDDLDLARQFAVRLLLYSGRIQNTLLDGIAIDPRYMTQILDDVAFGQPNIETIKRRMRWASAAGQIVKALLALINDPDPRVRKSASWKEAIEQAEKLIGRPRRNRRSTRSGFQRQLACLKRSLHMCCAWELAREGYKPPRSADGLMLNAILIHQQLWTWHEGRSFRGTRNAYLDATPFGKWPGMAHDDAHGVPVLAINIENLTAHGRSGRPRNNFGEI
jgi:hypothetical protein